jgi:UPF0755 protein
VSDADTAPRRRGRGLAVAFAALLAAASLAAGAVAWALAPVDRAAGTVRFDVPAGSTLRRVASELARAGLVRSELAMIALARWRGAEGSLHAGEYELSAGWGTRRILEQIVAGRVVTYEVTLPEGLDAAQIAARLELAGVARADAFLAVARDPSVAAEFGVEGPGLEGYLFPETYQIPHGLTPKQVAKVLVDQFHRAWGELAADASARGLSMREAVTLASIVEKETGAPEERPLVASVFANRLARHMRLDSDPTTIYGIAAFDGNLRRADLEDESNRWNTYRIDGLPPTPIASPGAASLRAAVHPAETPYLYFVSRNDGTHVFAQSLAEHNANVARYQKRASSR